MKTMVRTALVLAALGSSAYAAPFLAIGDNAELFLTGTAGVRYDDNILLQQNKESDGILEFVPGLLLNFGKNSLVTGSFSAAETLDTYFNHSELNVQLLALNFDAKYQGEKLKLEGNASYNELNQNTFAANGAISGIRDMSAAGLTGEYKLSDKTSFGSGFNFNRTFYETSGYIGEKDYSIPANVYYSITSKVDLSAGVTYTRSNLDNGWAYNDYYYNIGTRGQFTPKLSGHASIGFDDRTGSGTGAGNNSGLSYFSGLAYQYSDKTSFTLDANKTYTNATTGGTQNNYNVTLGGQTQITPAWTLSSSLSWRYIGYEGTSRVDNYLEGDFGATYAISRQVSVTASYAIRNNASNTSGAEFSDNVVSLSISGRY